MNTQPLLTGILLMLGFGFLVANAKLAFDYFLFLKRRRGALLTWGAPKPPPTRSPGLGVAPPPPLGAGFRSVFRAQASAIDVFLYYAYFFPIA